MEEFVSKDHRNVGLRVPFSFGRHDVVIPHYNQLDKVILWWRKWVQALPFRWFKVNIWEVHSKNVMEHLVTHREHAPKNCWSTRLLTVAGVIRRKYWTNYAVRNENSTSILLFFRYDEQHLDIDDFKPCNFFEHASCVAKMKNEADHSYDHACLPACDHTSIHQESIHVCINYTYAISKLYYMQSVIILSDSESLIPRSVYENGQGNCCIFQNECREANEGKEKYVWTW